MKRNLSAHRLQFSLALALKGTAPLADWQLGNAFSLTNQRLELGFSQIDKKYEISIRSTLPS
ncbi:MAG: hypothetical protein AB4911_03885 [Oscillochloridaceae bacterium umkhey_bin13]